MPDRVLQFLRDESGATSSEYAIMASLIAGVIFVAVTQFGISIRSLFERTQAAFSGGGS